MNRFNIVKRYYDKGYWSIDMVRNAVTKGWITAVQFTEITGEVYTNEVTQQYSADASTGF